MHDIAAGNGFLDILEMSWFWHRPTLWNEPCGTCNPCKSAMTKGIEHRIPAYGRFRYRLMQNTTPLILLKKIPYLHEKAKRLQVWFKSHG